MNPKAFRNAKFLYVVLIACISFSIPGNHLLAAQLPGSLPDIVIKISRLDRSLEVIDSLTAAAGREPETSPSAMVKGLLHGTDWIDFSRPIVIGIEIKDPKPDATLLIPFSKPNPEFQSGFQAVGGPDYYLLALPPGGEKPSEALESILAAAAGSKLGASASAEITMDNLLKKVDPKIQQALSSLKSIPPEQIPENMPLSPDQLRAMIEKGIDTARQIKTLDIRLDLSSDTVAYEIALLTKAGTEMAELFTKGKETGRLEGYRPRLQMNFKSRSFQTEKMLALIGNIFGKFYQSMGIDFAKIVELCTHFTGEMAGGMSIGEKQITLEMIYVLKGEKQRDDFIEKIYLPWLTDFGKVMQDAMEKQLNTPVEPVFSRMPDSTVAGRPVYGIQFRVPIPPGAQTTPDPLLFKVLSNYAFRMTMVDDLLLTASTDEQLGRLIQIAGKLRPSPAKGPLMTFDYDLAAYVESLRKILPGFTGTNQPLPRLGKMVMILDADKGRASLKSTVKTKDIQTLAGYFTGVPPSGIHASKKQGTGPEPAKTKTSASDQKAGLTPKTEAYGWLKKGTLAVVSGDNPSAVKHFNKAIEIEPENSDAHFQLGVTLGEMGEYSNAIEALNRAISLNPKKGAYAYARGRVYLLSGEKEKAMIDFKRAAELGDLDARHYLEKVVAYPGN